MPPPSRRRRSRLLVRAWAVLSILLVAWTLRFLALSVPVSEEAALGMTVGEPLVSAGDRLLVLPVADPREVTTLPEVGPVILGAHRDVLYYEPDDVAGKRGLPFQNPGGALARALAYVAQNETTGNWDVVDRALLDVTTLRVDGVPGRNATTNVSERTNLTVNLTLVEGREGFLVKRDAAADVEPRLVPIEAVHGRVVRAAPAGSFWQALVISIIGLVVPVAVLVSSRRARGAAVAPASGEDVCPECGNLPEEGVGFCVKCGSFLQSER